MTSKHELTITKEHLALLPQLWFEYDDSCEFGAPCVDPKRPYGNSDVYGDLLEHTNPELHAKINTPATPGHDSPVDELGTEECLTDDEREHLLQIHREMTDVLSILVTSLLFQHNAERRAGEPEFMEAGFGGSGGDEIPALELLGTWKRDFPYNRWEKKA